MTNCRQDCCSQCQSSTCSQNSNCCPTTNYRQYSSCYRGCQSSCKEDIDVCSNQCSRSCGGDTTYVDSERDTTRIDRTGSNTNSHSTLSGSGDNKNTNDIVTTINLNNTIFNENRIEVPINISNSNNVNVRITSSEYEKYGNGTDRTITVTKLVPIPIPVPGPTYPTRPPVQKNCCNVVRPCAQQGCQNIHRVCNKQCTSRFMYVPVNPCQQGCERRSYSIGNSCTMSGYCQQSMTDCSSCNVNDFYASYGGYQQCGGCFYNNQESM